MCAQQEELFSSTGLAVYIDVLRYVSLTWSCYEAMHNYSTTTTICSYVR